MRKIAIVVAIIAITLGLGFSYGQHKRDRMDAYAAEHGCTWHYSEYMDREPVCK